MATTFANHLLGPDPHANRPAATDVPSGALYSCSDHDLVYQSDGATWTTWATVGGGSGGSGALTLIETQTVSGSPAAITFSAIPGTYEDLLILGAVRSATAAPSGSVNIRVGNSTVDTGSNYSYMLGRQGSATSDLQADAANEFHGGNIVGDSVTANLFSPVEYRLGRYADATFFRSVLLKAVYPLAAARRIGVGGGVWHNNADVIDIVEVYAQDHASGHFAVGSELRLYGLG